jgi:hypothetical protein
VPFTISHVAAILPLKKRPLCFPALVIGAMSPDFSYIIEVFGPSIAAHSVYGILYFCLPASWLLLLVYNNFLKDFWEELFPWLQNASRSYPWYVVPLSIVIGAGSHVVWDSFTHPFGYAVVQWNALQSTLFMIETYPVTAFNMLQHASAVVGGFAVGFSIYRASQSSKQGLVTSKRTLIALVVAIIFIALLLSIPALYVHETIPLKVFVVQIAFRTLAALMIVFVTYPFFVSAQKRYRLNR